MTKSRASSRLSLNWYRDARVVALTDAVQGHTNAKAGVDVLLSRFERQVNRESILAPDERTRRAAHARRAYMTTLALKASRGAEKRRAARAAQEPADAGKK